ncbi:1734_t:CDS:2, partial [Scutellospora calospora]
FMFRWLLLIPYGVGVMSKYDYIWMHITAIIAFNMGGIVNSLLYIMIECPPDLKQSKNTTITTTTKLERLSFNSSDYNTTPKSLTVPLAVFLPSIFNSNNPTFNNCDSFYGLNSSLDNDDYDEKTIKKLRPESNQNKFPSDDYNNIQTETSDINDEFYLALRC